MKVKLFEYTDDGKRDFEKEINDFMATVKVLDVKFPGLPSSESFNSVVIVLVLDR